MLYFFLILQESLDEDTTCLIFIQFQRTGNLFKYLYSHTTDRNREKQQKTDRGKKKKNVWRKSSKRICIVVYYVSKLIQDAKRNVIRQNCSLLLCFSKAKEGERERGNDGRGRKSRYSDDAACSLRDKRQDEKKRTILSNRIRIHVSIRSAIVILNSKLHNIV